MKIRLVSIGKIKSDSLYSEPIEYYLRLLSKFSPVEREGIKIASRDNEREAQNEALCQWIEKLAKTEQIERIHFTLLDEKGSLFSSEEFSKQIQAKLNRGHQSWIILCAGAYGFSDSVLEKLREVRAKNIDRWSLSPLIFAHDLAQLVTVEQLYRGFAILNHHPYHHG